MISKHANKYKQSETLPNRCMPASLTFKQPLKLHDFPITISRFFSQAHRSLKTLKLSKGSTKTSVKNFQWDIGMKLIGLQTNEPSDLLRIMIRKYTETVRSMQPIKN